ncbi:Kelch 21 [Fusarium albosuccineum]|uniref:Kelch 21 n=1 Tax=Fusarium albosuccineum TaxID=1237068 RepID=A0A8H4L5A0_9HYPO|nr:Kelch 21 [Fusarium albosuccineum]
MKSISKTSAASSKPFKFLVDPDQKEFTIHSALVAHQSPVLAALFVYTGDYDSWKPLPETSRSDAITCKSYRDYMNKVLAEPEEMFRDEPTPEADAPSELPTSIPEPDYLANARRRGQPLETDKAPQTPQDMLLHHARVYIWADRYAIYRLMEASFKKLYVFLIMLAVPVDKDNLNSVVPLLRLCFKELVPERLRELVLHYTTCYVEGLWDCDVESEDVRQLGGFVEGGDGLESYLTVSVASRESRKVLSLGTGSIQPLFHLQDLYSYEASSGTYDLNDHSIVLVRRMVDYFYTGDYGEMISDDGGADTEEDIPPLSLHTAMLALADKYDIKELRLLATKKYAAELRSDADSSDFIRSVTDIYNLPFEVSSGLRERALDFAIHKLRDSSTADETDDLVDELMETCPEFTKELLRLLLRHPIMGVCRNCGTGETVPIEPLQCRYFAQCFDDQHAGVAAMTSVGRLVDQDCY